MRRIRAPGTIRPVSSISSDVLIIPSASRSLGYAMDQRIVQMDQMNQKHVSSNNVLLANSNVKIKDANQGNSDATITMIVETILTKKTVESTVVLQDNGNVLVLAIALMNSDFVMETTTVPMEQMRNNAPRICVLHSAVRLAVMLLQPVESVLVPLDTN